MLLCGEFCSFLYSFELNNQLLIRIYNCLKKYKTYKDWDGKNGISDAYYDYRYKIFQQNQKQHKKPNVEFSTAQEKKDKDSNTIFSFRITNNNLSKSIVAIQFQYESTMYDLMSVIKETHVENKKISISPQTYVDYNFRIDYNSKNEGYSYRLYVIEVIYEDGTEETFTTTPVSFIASLDEEFPFETEPLLVLLLSLPEDGLFSVI